MLIKYFTWLTLLFSFISSSPAQPSTDSGKVDLDSLEKQTVFFLFEEPNYDMAFKLIERGISLSRERRDSSSLAFFYSQKGVLYHSTDKNLSLKYFFKSKNLYTSLKDSSRIAGIYRSMGFSPLLNVKQRNILLRKAIWLSRKIKDTSELARIYNALGSSYYYRQMADSALYFYRESLLLRPYEKCKSPKDFSEVAGIYNNIGVIYKDSGEHHHALQYFYKALSIITSYNKDFYFNIQSNLADTYFRLNIPDSAFHYFNLIKDRFHHRPDLQENCYVSLSRYYEKNGQVEEAFLYFKKSDSIRRILNEKEKTNALTLLELEYDSQIKKEQLATMGAEISKAQNTRIFLMAGLLLTVFFFVALFYQQKQKARKKRALLNAEKKLLNSELQKSEIQKRYLNDELHYTNKELTSFATGLVQNQTLLNDIYKQIGDIGKEKSIHRVREQLREMRITLMQVFKDTEKNEEFIEKSREINHSLIFYLKSNFPQLSESDINLLILLFLKFSTKEISTLYNMEANSVKVKRYRLRKKLYMAPEDSFEEFFSEIVEETKMKHTG